MSTIVGCLYKYDDIGLATKLHETNYLMYQSVDNFMIDLFT